ncbi:MAG: PEP/pyruvate-binding domain-containing protein [Syntrophobacteraceae bacterium]|nr:PEP/pyruvate-binding domain-containing protein [Syntrophobacteraceae bacterium]
MSMGKLSTFLKRKLFRKDPSEIHEGSSAEELRAAFKSRYLCFRLLLSANNKALEIMADLQEALRGNRPFGMSLVRADTTAVSVNVFRMIQNLDRLAPGKYSILFNRFKEIEEEVEGNLAARKLSFGEELVIPLEGIDKDMADQVGSKMASLGEVKNVLALPVPNGFVVSSAAYRKFFEHNDLQAEIDRLLQTSSMDEMDNLYELSANIQQLIIGSTIPGELETAIVEAYRALEAKTLPGVKISMRSSALGEDSAGTSFAGQYRSELNVGEENVLQAYKEIVAGKYNLQAIFYRLNRGILDEDIAMCVGAMVMINASAGGVMYSRNPLDIRDDSVLLSSAWGLPKSIVDGGMESDLFVVSRKSPMTVTVREIGTKNLKFACDAEEGVCRMEVAGELNRMPSLDDARILELAQIALMLEEHYGAPQDVEWALDENGALFILQSRTLKQQEHKEPLPLSQERETIGSDILLRGGSTASPGAGWGPVFVVRKDSDTLLFPRGAVLVAAQAHPRWAALLGRACAVVTEQGSIAGHLANLAREFAVPALFGVQGAVQRLENGRDVTVDADGLTVYRGRVEALIDQAPVRKNFMAGSPVHRILEEVANHIVPLHLLDPDSTMFRPENCQTLHDITRFSHEMSVREMFNFGRDHRFSEKMSKQLVCEVPMQWWLINLDDGFREGVRGKFVYLQDIVSIPTLAIWEGITAVPWAGPPPIDARGFMSILLEAGINPALDPSMPSPYSARNYFMVSRNFCSLSSRFGFHFSTVEALVGERSSENYISFQLKGGAADYDRRLRRARFVGEILEQFGFRAEVKEDGVFARMEGYSENFMKERLRILGYLIMHTRQLDMIMSNEASYQAHRTKILKDIHETLKPSATDAHIDNGA